MKLQVKDIMVSPVFLALENDTVEQLRGIMKKKDIHAIPIVEMVKKLPGLETVIKGIVTVSDLSTKLKKGIKAKEIMASIVHVIHKDTSIKSAAKMMLKHKVHHLIVMDEGEIIGMISSIDFVKLVEQYDLV